MQYVQNSFKCIVYTEYVRIYPQWLLKRSQNYLKHLFEAAKRAQKGCLLIVASLRLPFCRFLHISCICLDDIEHISRKCLYHVASSLVGGGPFPLLPSLHLPLSFGVLVSWSIRSTGSIVYIENIPLLEWIN